MQRSCRPQRTTSYSCKTTLAIRMSATLSFTSWPIPRHRNGSEYRSVSLTRDNIHTYRSTEHANHTKAYRFCRPLSLPPLHTENPVKSTEITLFLVHDNGRRGVNSGLCYRLRHRKGCLRSTRQSFPPFSPHYLASPCPVVLFVSFTDFSRVPSFCERFARYWTYLHASPFASSASSPFLLLLPYLCTFCRGYCPPVFNLSFPSLSLVSV